MWIEKLNKICKTVDLRTLLLNSGWERWKKLDMLVAGGSNAEFLCSSHWVAIYLYRSFGVRQGMVEIVQWKIQSKRGEGISCIEYMYPPSHSEWIPYRYRPHTLWKGLCMYKIHEIIISKREIMKMYAYVYHMSWGPWGCSNKPL